MHVASLFFRVLELFPGAWTPNDDRPVHHFFTSPFLTASTQIHKIAPHNLIVEMATCEPSKESGANKRADVVSGNPYQPGGHWLEPIILLC